MNSRVIAIAGGGASGTLLAAELLRRSDDVAVVLIEPRERIGLGVAYSTDCPAHLLNVPASNMSAFADDPGHFVRWLSESGYGRFTARAFVPRTIYGEYVSAIALAARRAAGDRFNHVHATAVDVELVDGGVRVRCSDESVVEAAAFVLASGNAAPARWARISEGAQHSGRFFGSAWESGALVPTDTSEEVLLLGTGLTAVDAVLGLRYNGHRGRISMISRRGLLPHEHRLFDTPPAAYPEAQSGRELLGSLRERARDVVDETGNWRPAVDGMRPNTNALWRSLTLADQRQFVRHAMPYWNVHRHRMAPDVAKNLAELMAGDRLRMLAGRTGEMLESGGALRVPVALRGTGDTLMLETGRVINCSGPENDYRKLDNPLIRSLLERRLMTPYPLNIGVEVSAEGALVGNDGVASDRLFTIGPVRFGTLIETTAIPEVRAQARDLTEVLLTGNALSRTG